MDVCIVIVTYNRVEWLKQLLNTAIKQAALDGIVIVNNNSSDGTTEFLNAFSKEHSGFNWHIQHLDRNTGGAGGFSLGMKTAHQLGYEWSWLMDDDVTLKDNALQNLLSFSNQGDILHGVRLNPDGQPYFWQHTFISWIGFSRPYPDSAFKQSDVWQANSSCFEGALIHKRVFDKIGYANPDYFLTWDDTEFGYRASQIFKILYCNTKVMQRIRGHDNVDIKLRSLFRASDLYRYYHIRNRFLLIKTVRRLESSLVKKLLKTLTFHTFTFFLIPKEVIRCVFFKDFSFGLKALLFGFWDGATGQFSRHRFLK